MHSWMVCRACYLQWRRRSNCVWLLVCQSESRAITEINLQHFCWQSIILSTHREVNFINKLRIQKTFTMHLVTNIGRNVNTPLQQNNARGRPIKTGSHGATPSIARTYQRQIRFLMRTIHWTCLRQHECHRNIKICFWERYCKFFNF